MRFMTAVFSLVWISAAAAQDPAKPAEVPNPAAAAEAKKTVEKDYEDDYKAAKTNRSAKKSLAAKLLAAAATVEGPQRYALLTESSSLGAEALDPTTALTAIAELAKSFQVKAEELRSKAFEKIRSSKKLGDNERELTDAYLQLAAKAQSADDYDSAVALAREAIHPKVLSNSGGYSGLVHEAQQLIVDAAEAQKEYEKYRAAGNKLAAAADDPAATLDRARFTCFYKADWAQGAPLLAKAGELLGKAGEKYLQVGKGEQTPPAETSAQLELAESWFGLAQKEKDPYKRRMAIRAVYWYTEAWDSLSPPQREKLQRNIEKSQDLAGRINLLLFPSKPRSGPGGWKPFGKYLDSPGTGQSNVLEFFLAPPPQYDLELTLVNPSCTMGVGAVSSGMRLAVTLSPESDNSISLTQDKQQNAPKSPGPKTFQSGKQYNVLIQVRANLVTVSSDGVTILEWRGGAKDLALPGVWNLQNNATNNTFFLGHHQNAAGGGGYKLLKLALTKR
jgi:hypothetical protein